MHVVYGGTQSLARLDTDWTACGKNVVITALVTAGVTSRPVLLGRKESLPGTWDSSELKPGHSLGPPRWLVTLRANWNG